ncbi:MAG: hypothetical protein ACI4IQ_00235 [Eubacterium sp.]
MNNKLTFALYPRELLFAFFIIMLPASLVAEMTYGITWAAYTDEVLCIICGLYIVYCSFKRGIKGTDLSLLTVLFILTVWGLLSNGISKVITNLFPVMVDVVCLLKMFFAFLIYKQVAAADRKMLIIKYLLPLAKLIVGIGAICGTLSLFVDIGMAGERRYGIPSFSFVFRNEGRYGYIVACCLLVILIAEKRGDKRKIYEFLAIMNMVYTTKGVVYVVIACYIILVVMWKKSTKLSVQNIIFLAIGGTAVSILQINTYIRDQDSPRMRLIRYGFKTANSYFPFGSGFSTYGSDMAAKNYSKLYDLYGFSEFFGLSRDIGFGLNDCYLGMLLGQFGYIGTFMFVILLVMVFLPINKVDLGRRVKALTMAIFIGLVISGIGTAIIKSSIGVFVFAFLGLMCGYSGHGLITADNDPKNNNPNQKRTKIVIKGI